MSPLPADFIQNRACKPICEKFLTLPNEAAGNDTGDRVWAMLTRCSGPTGMKKRPDSRKLFERKKHGIQLHCDNFRTGCQTGPVRWPGFF